MVADAEYSPNQHYCSLAERERSNLQKKKLKFTSFLKDNQMMKTRQATPEHSLWKSLPGTGRPMDFSVVI